ncbi:MAG: hypothetical protein QF535_00285 [Anaerolineales bacterium]|jgi:hypothetical protein|nr:hypothetical protein [Anaerolineales bacterium]
MPNLKEKIGAQLKGVKKEELKDYLSRTGYAQKKREQAGKVESPISPNKNLFSKKFTLLGLIAVIVIGVVYFMSGYQGVESPTTIETQTREFQFVDICQGFSSLENEISCENAVNFTLEEYPGEVVGLDKTILEIYKSSDDRREQAERIEKSVWLVRIELTNALDISDETVRIIEVYVDRTTGEVSLYGLFGV